MAKEFTLNDETVEIAEFIRINEDLSYDEIEAIVLLDAGEKICYGGGAVPISILRRIK